MTIRVLSENVSQPITAKFCVIGAGFAGILIARKLAQAGHRVVLLESGYRSIDAPTQTLGELDGGSNRLTGPQEGRLRGLGGASRQWAGRLLPLSASDVGERHHIGLAGWPITYNDLDRYRREVELMFGVDDGSYEENAVADLRLGAIVPRNDPDITPRYPKWINFRQCDLAYLFKQELDDSELIEVWLGATVTTFKLDNDTCNLNSVVAESLSGHRLQVNSANFILAAGTIETTRLLLLLNRQSDDRAFEGCSALGCFFQDHLGGTLGYLVPRDAFISNRWFGYHLFNTGRRSVHLETTAKAQAEDRAASGFAHVFWDIPVNSSMEVLKNFIRGLQSGKASLPVRGLLRLGMDGGQMARMLWWRYRWNQLFIPETMGLKLHIWIEQVPNAASRITLSNQVNRLGTPRASVNWQVTQEDEHTVRKIVDRVRGYWMRSGLAAACPIQWVAQVADREARLTDLMADVFHPSGTTRMGIRPADSVVDSNLSCHNIGNLTVCSASVFPVPGSANPTLALMQLALRAGDHLAVKGR